MDRGLIPGLGRVHVPWRNWACVWQLLSQHSRAREARQKAAHPQQQRPRAAKKKSKVLKLTHIFWNLERWCWWTYLQGSSGNADIESRVLPTAGEGEGRMNGESNMKTYITICKVDSQWEFALWLRELKPGLCKNLQGSDGERGGREVQEGEDVYIPVADSHWCIAETNTRL